VQLREYARQQAVKGQVEHWEKTCASIKPVFKAKPGTSSIAKADRMFSLRLSEEETESLIHKIRRAYETEINDLLLTALAVAYQQWTGERSVVIDVEGHGREEIGGGLDLTRTVGWFTSLYPVKLEVKSEETLGELLVRTKGELRRIPDRGIGYGVLKYFSDNQEIRHRLMAHTKREIAFVYIGQWDQLLSGSKAIVPTYEPTGRVIEDMEVDRHLMAITAAVVDRCLDITLTYNENVHEHSSIYDFAENYRSALRALISQGLSVISERQNSESSVRAI
jgi:non-ribosomal peptide synthase protein (TIGR01720 family)